MGRYVNPLRASRRGSVNGAGSTASASAVADVTWLGFNEVRLASTTGTGTDWTQPPPPGPFNPSVPSLGTFGLAALGSLMAAMGVRRLRA